MFETDWLTVRDQTQLTCSFAGGERRCRAPPDLGKTTLLRTIVGFNVPVRGYCAALRLCAMVFQVTRLVESASVSDTIALIAASDVSDAHSSHCFCCAVWCWGFRCKHRCKRFQVANVAVLSWYVRCLLLAELLCLTSPFWDLIALCMRQPAAYCRWASWSFVCGGNARGA